MKNKLAKLLFAISVIAAPLAARADLIWYEGFNYPCPTNNGPGGSTTFDITNCSSGAWINFSGSGLFDMVLNTNGGYTHLEVATTSSPGGIDRKDDDYRPLATAPGSPYTNGVQVVYASFTVICTNLPNGAGSYFASFYSTAKGFCGRVQAFTNGTVLPRTWRLGVTANGASTEPADGGYPVDLALNTPYQVVEELDPTSSGLKAATIWINPVNINQTGFSPAETHYTSSDSIGFQTTNQVNAYAFRQAGSFGNGFWLITNVDTATTFAEAATNIWTTNAISPVIVYQPVGATNFVGAVLSLSAVANGQGLGNMTYQWQVSATPDNASPQNVQDVSVDAAGYNANILNFTYAGTSDSGYYSLIATTPYGLSVTSSVAKLLITAALVPPSFVTEPVRQTSYKGQTVTFSTSVTSPGNVAFTWYSNNVVMTDGQVDNGYSSAITLHNVQTNLSGAIFEVAVTNDYANYPTNGVVSTNAVLTVLNVPAVSIAYLRSLIDPNTFVTTSPLTQPYEATGIITSFTNFTTGNTACYYLQDATAGIDIFVTGGQTFRPQPGDMVTFDGVLSTFNANTGGLELYADPSGSYSYTSYTIVSSGNPLPAATVIPFTVTNDYGYLYVNTNLMASRVTLTNVYFGARAGTVISTSANDAVTVTNAGGLPFALQFYSLDLDTAGQTLPAFAYSVTGNLVGFTPSVVLAVSQFSDIDTNPPPTIIPTASAGITGITLTADGNVVITGTNAQTTGVYYLLTSTDMALPLSQWTVVATNVVSTSGDDGAFTFTGTNVATPGAGSQFYILSNTNSNHP